MYKGYVIFFTESWIDIVNNLLETLILFSVYDIEVNCINFKHDFKNDRIRSNTIIVNPCDFYNITTCKLISTINSNFDIGLILDGDMIVTHDIDKIFEDNEERIKKLNFPLFAKHPHNPYNQWKHITSKVTDAKPKMKWVYSNYLFTKEHKWFFEEALDYMINVPIYQRQSYYPVPEESVLNALLAKYNVDYDLGYNYFPNGFDYVIDYYLNDNQEGKEHIKNCYLDNDCQVKIYAFHGHHIKNVGFVKQIIEKMKLHKK
jgi:hypothetical protein